MKGIVALIFFWALSGCTVKTETEDFVAQRIFNSATIELNGDIETVFPLFGPIREKEWEPGWNPVIVYSDDPLVEKYMIFKSPGRFEGEDSYLWMISQYDPESYLIEYTVHTADRIWTINVNCQAVEDKTLTTVAYTYTGLNARGNDLNRVALNQMYARNLQDWQEALDDYLEKGTR